MGISGFSRSRGVTLVELLCVISIIAILATLVMRPAHRAYARARGLEWDFKMGGFTSTVGEQLQDYYAPRTEYSALSVDQLQEEGILFPETASLIRCNPEKLQYFPFSSTDPDEKVILRLRYFDGSVEELLKKQATDQRE